MRKLNIALFCDSVMNLTAGSCISTLRFADLLKKRGHHVVFITSKNPGFPKFDVYKGINTYRFWGILLPKSEGQLYISFPSKQEIKNVLVKEKIDILHIMIPTPASIGAIKVAKSLGVKVVFHSHTQPENLFLHLPKYIPSKLINGIFYKYMFWIYKKADAIISPSKFCDRLLKKRDPSIKTIVISNGANLSRFKKVDSIPFMKKFCLSKKNKNILFVGRLHPEKKVNSLIRAMPIILEKEKKAHLVIVGFGHMREELEKLSKKLGMEKNVTFCGKVSDDELIMAYNSSDLFVLPSLAELEGMAVLEAMACGNPLLIANSSESASVDFVENNGFLFTPENSKDLAEKALIILQNDNLRKQMSKKSKILSKEYDINKSIDKLEEVYYSLLR